MKQKTVNSPLTFPVAFPITLAGQWQSPDDEGLSLLSARLTSWLLDEGSLTARLKSHCTNFRVKVVGEQQQLCSAQEACNIIKVGEPILVREVILYCDNIPQVFARSLLPLATLTGKEQALANLGEQPLGQVLFNNPSLQRQRLELSSFGCDSSVAALAAQLTDLPTQELWGRRSIFILENKPLMVAEVFLPNAFAYQ
ncbi:chorismate--pyruvate lyase family protein [Colwellia piezophila]|uniref:chorismate--pyruvate lyase family protein n=1 Tax=Colwellia piezophila TaxID=211668 RepID=UPI00037BD319|nr:chorismate lyase [Colwellia piezophila]